MQKKRKSDNEVIGMLGSFITKDITSVYGIEKISDDGIVVVNKKEVAI